MTGTVSAAEALPGGAVGVSVIDPDDAVRSVLADHVRAVDGRTTAYADADAFAMGVEPRAPGVVVIGPSLEPDKAVAVAEDLCSAEPGHGVVMVVYDLSATVLQRAMRVGVVDVIAVSAEDAELVDAIERAAGRVRCQAPPPEPAPPVPPPQAPGPRCRLATVFCTKGGAGKSVVAVNLAVALAKRTVQPVVLVDADLQFGDVALMLQLQPVHTIIDAVQAGDRLDRALGERLLLRHEPSGVLVLAAPTEPTSADQITRDDLRRVLGVLREIASYIVVDTSPNFGEVTLAALEDADDILVLAGLDVMSLKSARVGLQTMRVLGLPFANVKFVLNRANTRVGLTEADAERALRLKVDAALPSELDVATSVNTGTPVVLSSPRSKFAKAVEGLAAALAAQAATT